MREKRELEVAAIVRTSKGKRAHSEREIERSGSIQLVELHGSCELGLCRRGISVPPYGHWYWFLRLFLSTIFIRDNFILVPFILPKI